MLSLIKNKSVQVVRITEPFHFNVTSNHHIPDWIANRGNGLRFTSPAIFPIASILPYPSKASCTCTDVAANPRIPWVSIELTFKTTSSASIHRRTTGTSSTPSVSVRKCAPTPRFSSSMARSSSSVAEDLATCLVDAGKTTFGIAGIITI